MGSKKSETLARAYALGYEYDEKYGNCVQCVIAAVQDVFGLVDNEVFKSAYGLAGGVSRSGDGTCGAFTGGVMALSSKYGRERENFAEKEGYSKAFDLSKGLHDRFIEEYGSGICHDIQKKVFGRSFDMWDPVDQAEFAKLRAEDRKCPEVVGKATRWVAELLVAEEE